MSLQLPPPRRLPEPDRMIETILRDEPVERARSPWAMGVAAAIVLILVAGGFAVAGLRNRAEVANPPMPSVSATTPATTGPVIPPGPYRKPRKLGEGALFDHFVVHVTQSRWTEVRTLVILAEVCVRTLPPDPTGDTTRISWDPWHAGTSPPEPPVGLAADQTPFPRDTYAKVGQCVSGWLSFDRPSSLVVDYGNQLGDRADWDVLPAQTGRPGDRIDLPYLRVTLSSAARMGKVYVISATVCVRTLPTGTPKTGLDVAEGAFTVTTTRGEVTVDQPLDGVPPLPTTFPAATKLRVGQCVSGYIPFGTGARETTHVDYHDSVGQAASWRVGR